LAVVTDLLLTDTGDIYYSDDFSIIDTGPLARQNMVRFLRSEASDVPLNPAMAFGILDYAGMPNTRESANIIRDDFMEKTSILEAFREYTIDADIYPSDIDELQMEVKIADVEGLISTIEAPILFQNGFVSNIPSAFETDTYDTTTALNVVERVTLVSRTNEIPVKYLPQNDEIVIFSSSAEPVIDSDGNLTDLQSVTGNLSLTSTTVTIADEVPALDGKEIDEYVFSVSGVFLNQVEDIPESSYEFTADDDGTIQFDQVYSDLDYTVNYHDTVALVSEIKEVEIELPPPQDLIFPYSVENRRYSFVLDRYLAAGTYVIQYRASAPA